jgi:FAD/FMN-containing dehydrogenase
MKSQLLPWSEIQQVLIAQNLTVISDRGQLDKLSLDYFHFSPILDQQLREKRGNLVVRPKTEAEVILVAQTCVNYRIPLTVRGAGTGNYGQCIPLDGGIILDLSQLNQILDLKPGLIRVEPGVKMASIDKKSEEIGWELRMAPSTYRTATIGGFIGGGSVGMGSVNYGLISDRGNVQALRIVTLEDTPQIIELRGDQTQAVIHAYGTNGIITQLEIPLAPAYPWTELIVTFDNFSQAINFGQALSESSGIVKKQVAVHAASIGQYFVALKDYLSPQKDFALLMVSEYDLEAVKALIQDYDGEITYLKNTEETSKISNILEFNWNHTTLLARSIDSSLTYLQVFYWTVEKVEQLYQYFGDEVMIHLEFIRVDGKVIPAGLPLVRFTTEERLNEIIAYHQNQGTGIANPHVYTIEEGGSGHTNPEQLAFKKQVDPYGLMNPGKMKAWSI